MSETFLYTSLLSSPTFILLLVISGMVVLEIGMIGTNEGYEGLVDEGCC